MPNLDLSWGTDEKVHLDFSPLLKLYPSFEQSGCYLTLFLRKAENEEQKGKVAPL